MTFISTLQFPCIMLAVVTVDVIFHKCKPVGQRRLVFASYLKALCAAAEESNMNVFDLIGVLGMQIQPSKVFVAPQVGMHHIAELYCTPA